MKNVIASLVLICAVIAGSIWYTYSLEYVSEELSEINMSLQSSLETENLVQAKKEVEHMKEYLDRKEQLLSIMGNHNEITDIKQSIAELERFTKGGNVVDAAAKSEVLALMFDHMPEDSRLSLANIL